MPGVWGVAEALLAALMLVLATRIPGLLGLSVVLLVGHLP